MPTWDGWISHQPGQLNSHEMTATPGAFAGSVIQGAPNYLTWHSPGEPMHVETYVDPVSGQQARASYTVIGERVLQAPPPPPPQPVYIPQPVYVPPPPQPRRRFKVQAICSDPVKRAHAQHIVNSTLVANTGRDTLNEDELAPGLGHVSAIVKQGMGKQTKTRVRHGHAYQTPQVAGAY
eukprot:NODE_2146_length_977_cov_90.647629_g1760_i0.p2 GENE.NODE_2146_length_977_cov_90.647629_g1760_i0~~NODE_2146_length_977_cov_90.647629_g1760_i0.p2  ORF type:complete len:179 (-),score=20.89 NODE_2146_length_977_cov_90.647629_g1760_i0:170-706(-)